KTMSVSARLRDRAKRREAPDTLAGSPAPLKEPLPAPWLNERMNSRPSLAASGRDTACSGTGPVTGTAQRASPVIAPITDRETRPEERIPLIRRRDGRPVRDAGVAA